VSGTTVDVASPQFWLVFAVALIALTATTWPPLRRCLLAVINLGFLSLLLRRRLVAVLLGLGAAHVLLRAITIDSLKSPAIILMIGGTTVLFLLHKLPGLPLPVEVSALASILTTIGFAYVFLRLLDVIRTVWERRLPPPAFVDLVNYLVPFHMLAAGPIQAYEDFMAQPPAPPALTLGGTLTAVERITAGLFKKYVLAYVLLQVLSTRWQAGGWYQLFEMNAHFVWLYLDFSAYSDIAVGIGVLLGVATPENFNRPYVARNITEFWERWHISLSMYIRRHLFLPIQLALLRRSGGEYRLLSASIALLVTFLLCGAWHGLTFPYLAWGLFHAFALVVCNVYGEFLRRRLGAKGVTRYMASPLIRAVSTLVTFESVAFSVLLQGRYWEWAIGR
jgi:D-alanyl-lipoteichoic acid acyltransferase DltB (MBOAT superfamily)